MTFYKSINFEHIMKIVDTAIGIVTHLRDGGKSYTRSPRINS